MGSQVPFDRLSRSVDAWAARHPQTEVFGQIGRTAWRPAAMRWAEVMEAGEYLDLLKQAKVIVAHAGMGTVISAAEHGKPLIVMPRRADLGEHRNDHQEFTAKWLMTRPGISVVHDENELHAALDKADTLVPPDGLNSESCQRMVAVLREFIFDGVRPFQ